MSRERALASISVSTRRLSELEQTIAETRGGREALARLQQFQASRLASRYRDLAADGRYQPAVGFFLRDLYGPIGFETRDREFQSAARILGRMLPLGPLETLAHALELQALTLELDLRVARQLTGGPQLSAAEYRRAYRTCGDRPARERQIDLVVIIARALEHLVRQPSIEVLLRMSHLPATLAGFGTLQSFLERGFAAFRSVADSETFIRCIEERERAFMNELLAPPAVTRLPDAAPAAAAGAR
jgi:hypothetical protein